MYALQSWVRCHRRSGNVCTACASVKASLVISSLRTLKVDPSIGWGRKQPELRQENLQAWQRNFLSAQVAAGSTMAFRQGKQVMDVMRPESFTFMLSKQLLGDRQEALALQVLAGHPKEELSAVIEIGAEKYSYFELYCASPRSDGERATGVLKFLVDKEAYSDESFEVFCQRQELADVTTFVVNFVSLARQKYFVTGLPVEPQGAADSQPKSCCGLMSSKKKAPVVASPAGTAKPSKLLTARIPHLLLSCLVAKIDLRLDDKHVQRALELILLLDESQIVAQVNGELYPITVDPVHTDLASDARDFLRKALTVWIESYWLLILDINRPPAYKADSGKLQRLLFKEDVWMWTPTKHTDMDNEGRQVQIDRKHYFQSDHRSTEEIALVLWRLFDVSMCIQPSLVFQLLVAALNLAALHQRPSLNVLDKFMPINGPLHTVVAMNVFSYLPRIAHADVQLLMQQPEFYTDNIQDLLREGAMDKIQAVFTGTEGFSTLILAVQKLSRLEITGSADIIHGDLDRSTWEMTLAHITSVVEGNAVCIELVGRMMTAVIKTWVKDENYQPQDDTDMPSAFTLLHLLSCARRLRAACDSIKDEDIRQAFKAIINSFLALQPRQWVPLFNSVETVVFLLRFIGREDLNLCYERFHAENQALFRADSAMQDLLVEAQAVYSEPLINMKKSITELNTMDIRSKLRDRKSTGPQGATSFPGKFQARDWDIIVDIATCAAESMKEKYSLPMLPHHTQLVTMLMFAIQICLGPKDKSKPTTILARVGTGEGKSWIIGMLAAYVAKKGLTAHVAIDNATLLERDFRTMSDLFRKLSIKTHKGSFKPEYQVIYCSAMDIEMYFLDQMSKGAGDVNFKNCVMIVDEVDSLIVDENAYQTYVFDDMPASEVCEWWLTQGKNADKKTIEACEQWMQKIMNKMKDADEDARLKKFEGQHYHVDEGSGKIWALDEKTAAVKRNAWFLWLEALRRQRDHEHKIQYKCRQMVVCQKSCFSSYSFIFGLTGSLGTEAELEYTKKHFHASCFFVPRFLDTCSGTCKPIPKCIKTCVGKDSTQQLSRTAEVVQQYVKKVPAIVVVRNPDRVAQVIPELQKVLPKHAEGDKLGPGIIELLDMPGKEAEFQQLVETATLPIEVEGGKKEWRVTVTTAAGARGQDYQISDDAVDLAGGLLLVLEYIPDSEREWIQFLGRTARHDHPGQYAVILNRQDYKEALASVQENEAVEKKVLDKINAITAEKLGDAEKQLDKGVLMHEYTGTFWKWYTKSSRLTDQEKLDKFFKWVDLCDEFPDLTLEKIKQAFKALNTIYVDEREPDVPTERALRVKAPKPIAKEIIVESEIKPPIQENAGACGLGVCIF